jgi:hypothetical protein
VTFATATPTPAPPATGVPRARPEEPAKRRPEASPAATEFRFGTAGGVGAARREFRFASPERSARAKASTRPRGEFRFRVSGGEPSGAGGADGRAGGATNSPETASRRASASPQRSSRGGTAASETSSRRAATSPEAASPRAASSPKAASPPAATSPRSSSSRRAPSGRGSSPEFSFEGG